MKTPRVPNKDIRTKETSTHTIHPLKPESVASVLERESNQTIQNWLALVEQDSELTCISMTREDRVAYLPKLMRDLVLRLRLDSGLPSTASIAARDHGEIRYHQGYTAPMVVEESRFLEVSIFCTLQDNMNSIDMRSVLADVVTIADECDSQLKESMRSYLNPVTPKPWKFLDNVA